MGNQVILAFTVETVYDTNANLYQSGRAKVKSFPVLEKDV